MIFIAKNALFFWFFLIKSQKIKKKAVREDSLLLF